MDSIAEVIIVIFTGVVAAAALGSFVTTFLLWKNAIRTSQGTTFSQFLTTYRSPEMMAAIRALHDLWRESEKTGSTIKEIYNKKGDLDAEKMARQSPTEQEASIRLSLHNRRRLVAHLHQNLLVSVKNRWVRKKDVFSIWPSGSIQRIAEILNEIGLDSDKNITTLAKNYEKKSIQHKT